MRADVGAVGANLSDHVNIDIVAELHHHDSLDKYKQPHMAALAGLEYLLFHSGPVASNVMEGGLFWYSGDDRSTPVLQFHFLAGAAAEDGVDGVAQGRSGITLNCHGLRPKTRGSVQLASSDPAKASLIAPSFMGHPNDLETTVEGLKTGLDLFAQPVLAQHIRRIVLPDDTRKTDDDLRDFIRTHCRTSYHPVGTCRMGSDNTNVVDTDLKVRGVDGLRICGSSVFPSLIGSNTNAPMVMLAEKASDLTSGVSGRNTSSIEQPVTNTML